MPLYDDPDTVKLVTDLVKRGLGRREIAARLEISTTTVRKIIDPDFVQRERARHKDFDKIRAPKRRLDPEYQAYQARMGDTDRHRERARKANQLRRKGMIADPATWAEATTRLRAAAERVTAEERQRAEAGRLRSTANLSLEASLAANVLMRRRKTNWSALLEQLLLEAYGG